MTNTVMTVHNNYFNTTCKDSQNKKNRKKKKTENTPKPQTFSHIRYIYRSIDSYFFTPVPVVFLGSAISASP